MSNQTIGETTVIETHESTIKPLNKMALLSRLKQVAMVLASCLIALTAYHTWLYMTSIQETDDAYITAHIAPGSPRVKAQCSPGGNERRRFQTKCPG